MVPVVVAIVALVGTVTTAMVTREQVRHRIGTPNGQGNVIEMLERLLAGQTGQDARLASLEHRVGRIEVNHGRQLTEIADLSVAIAESEGVNQGLDD